MPGKRSVTILAVIIMLCLSACGANSGQEDMDRQTQHAENTDADRNENTDVDGSENIDGGEGENIDMDGTENIGTEESSTDEAENDETRTDKAQIENADEPTYDEMWERFHEQFYDGMSSEEMDKLLIERNEEYLSYSHYDIVTDYWENVREVRDVASRIDPLFFTDMKYYKAEDFADAPEVVIKLARNEIYAKHGYIFKDEDLNHYFNGCIWYTPECSAENFDDSVLNEYERANLKLLSELDNMK